VKCITAESGSRASTRLSLTVRRSSGFRTSSNPTRSLASNRITRRIKHSQSGALLQGKLFDDKGNRMGPSFSSKNGIRYRFYVSTALRGRSHQAGSVTRVSAPEIEAVIEEALRHKFEEQATSREAVWDRVERVVVRAKSILLITHLRKRSRFPGPPRRWTAPTRSLHHLVANPTRSWSKQLFALTPGYPNQ
jgi:hypothetical protein